MKTTELLSPTPSLRSRIVFLRFCLDTLGENFIYEEADHFKNYSAIVLCGVIKRLDKVLTHYCYRDFVKLYHQNFQWPEFPESQEEIYHKGLSKYKEIIKRQHAKLIHAQFLTDAYFFYPLIKASGLPLVVSLRGYDLFNSNIKSYLSAISPSVSKFLVKSESMKNALASYGVEHKNIQVIYGGVNTDKTIFKPRIPSENNIKILSAGRFVDKKGYNITLKFFSQLLKTYPNADLTLIGEGELREDLIELIANLGLSEKVTINNYLTHSLFIKELYKYNLFVLPSRTSKDGNKEGIPNVLKEAMASGMPVISTYHSGIPELIADNETGYLVQENDHLSMLDKFNTILENSENTFQICLNARFFIEKYFNAKKSAEQLERLYDYLLMPDFVRSAKDLNEGGKPSQFRMDLHLSKGCNSKCIMCGNWKTELWSSYTRKDVSKLFDQLKSFGVNQVRFHGQEPTLMKNIFSIIKEAKDKGFRTGLKTNALIFSDKNKVKMLTGTLDDLYLSIDSSNENIHNSMRGMSQSFATNMFLLKNLRKINPNVNVYFNAVIANINYRHLEGLLDIARSLNVNRVSFVHLANKNDEIKNFKLSKDQFKEFYFQIWPRILKKSLDHNIPVSIEPYFISLLGLPISHQIRKLTNPSGDFDEEIDNFINGDYGKQFYKKHSCYGVLDHGTIDWEGNVYPCCAMPRPAEYAIGNIHKNSFDEIWNSAEYIKYRKSILDGECRFQEQCGRAFKKTVQYNDYFSNQSETCPDPINDTFQNQYKDNDSLNKYKLEKIVYYSFAKTKFYQEKFKDFLKKNWKFNIPTLPYSTRRELKNLFPEKDIVPNYFNEDYGIYRTSSCGSEAFLYARPLKTNTFNRMATSFIHTGKWTTGQPWLKMTSINCIEAQYPVETSSFSSYSESRSSSNKVVPTSDDFIHEPISRIKDIYKLITSTKTSLIHTNPSHLKLLLHRFKKENMSLDKQYAVHSTYELLLPSTKNIIKQYLNCSVFNQYGCSEVGPISFTCSNGNNHIFSDTIHVDVLPDNKLNRQDVGRVVITHLNNFVMPFVKYYNGDYAYILKDNKCSCGLKSPLMGDIVGRDNQIIVYNSKVVFPLELDSLFSKLKNILIYKVIFQENQFFVKLVPMDADKKIPSEILIDNFKHFFKDINVQIHIEILDTIFPKRKGKYFNVHVK